MTNKNQKRPLLSKFIDANEFLNFYWLKKELVNFCRKNSLSTFGDKNELTRRILHFLKSEDGEIKYEKYKSYQRDSDHGLTLNTAVINYKNDTATGQFFKQHIGAHFHFNAYLRKFAKSKLEEKLTYGDLIKGWLAIESQKKDANYKTNIGAQFQYNQFISDFFSNEKGKTRQEAIDAWHFIKLKSAPTTYEHYKSLEKYF